MASLRSLKLDTDRLLGQKPNAEGIRNIPKTNIKDKDILVSLWGSKIFMRLFSLQRERLQLWMYVSRLLSGRIEVGGNFWWRF